MLINYTAIYCRNITRVDWCIYVVGAISLTIRKDHSVNSWNLVGQTIVSGIRAYIRQIYDLMNQRHYDSPDGSTRC